ncbi:MAG: murein transglycosylase A [Alphaproteobacteria bacterium]
MAGKPGRFGTAADWQGPCRAAQEIAAHDAAAIRRFLERAYRPFRVEGADGAAGRMTGYFEPELRGSLTRTSRFVTPIRSRPDNLIDVDLGQFREDLRGRRIAGRVENGRLVPYAARQDIERGAIDDRAPVLAWVDDPVDAFFLHIQGSGRIRLTDGSVLRVGYAGQNGHPYTAIGRVLIEDGHLTRQTVSMETIRGWMADNPDRAAALMDHNASYIFFRRLDLADPQAGPLGAEGLPLTPERSLAVDAAYYPYGVPIYLTTQVPDPAQAGGSRTFRKLMMAQDTGGAIRGAVRGDIFFGSGPQAGALAGPMKALGRFHVLVPHGLSGQAGASGKR